MTINWTNSQLELEFHAERIWLQACHVSRADLRIWKLTKHVAWIVGQCLLELTSQGDSRTRGAWWEAEGAALVPCVAHKCVRWLAGSSCTGPTVGLLVWRGDAPLARWYGEEDAFLGARCGLEAHWCACEGGGLEGLLTRRTFMCVDWAMWPWDPWSGWDGAGLCAFVFFFIFLAQFLLISSLKIKLNQNQTFIRLKYT